ncbi:unnamed protein product [Ectocarpus sp. 6 AP-2014]
MTVAAMRTVQDTLAVEYGREMGLSEDHPAFKLLEKQQRTSLKVSLGEPYRRIVILCFHYLGLINQRPFVIAHAEKRTFCFFQHLGDLQNIHTVYQARSWATPIGAKYEGFVTFVGGIWKMIADRRTREDIKRGTATPSTEGGAGVPRVPPPLPGGGRPDAIDAEEAALARELRMEQMRATVAKLNSERAAAEGRAHAFGRGATPAPVPGGGSGGGSSSSRKGMTYDKVRALTGNCFSIRRDRHKNHHHRR